MVISLSRGSSWFMEYATWSGQIVKLAQAVSRMEAEATPLGVPSPGSTTWHANLFQKLLPQVTEAPYLIVAVAGGTNIGKSTMFNHLVGFPASRVHPDATQTRHPVCLLPRGFSTPRSGPGLSGLRAGLVAVGR